MSVRTEIEGNIATVIIDRVARRNALDRETAAALAAAMRAFAADERLAVAVLWGAGGCFCAGADLEAVANDPQRANRLDAEGDGPMGISRMRIDKPVIAAVAGHAVAGGLELALWCDLRVVERSAVFGVFCRRWGVPLIDGGTVRLPRLVGLGHAMDMILTGRAVAADEALAMGLANRVVADGCAREAAEALAREIARFPQQCLRADRASALEQGALSLEDALANEFARGMEVVNSTDMRGGAARFAGGSGRGGDFGDFDRS